MPDRSPLKDRARALRRNATPAERKLWAILRGRAFETLKFRRQVPLGPYIADFVCFERWVVVECDGGQHADSAYDAVRDAWMRAEGFRVLRFWNDDMISAADGVVAVLMEALHPEAPSPSHAPRGARVPPSPARGEG